MRKILTIVIATGIAGIAGMDNANAETIYRGMIEVTTTHQPLTGSGLAGSANNLGVRYNATNADPYDVAIITTPTAVDTAPYYNKKTQKLSATAEVDFKPQGMSVARVTACNLPAHRRPPAWGGTQKAANFVVWSMDSQHLANLTLIPDTTTHALVAPTSIETIESYVGFLDTTANQWVIVPPPPNNPCGK